MPKKTNAAGEEMVTVCTWLTVKEYDALKARAARLGFSKGDRSGVTRMLTAAARDVARHEMAEGKAMDEHIGEGTSELRRPVLA